MTPVGKCKLVGDSGRFASQREREQEKEDRQIGCTATRALLARRALAIRGPGDGGAGSPNICPLRARRRGAHLVGPPSGGVDRAVLLTLLPVAGGDDLQFFFSLRRLLRGEARKAVSTMSGNVTEEKQKHPGQDPKYLEKFIEADDDLAEYDVEPDVFYGVCPPAPISSRISSSVFTHTFKFCGKGEHSRGRACAPLRVYVVLEGVGVECCADRQRMVSRFLLLHSNCQNKEQVQRYG
jgi:hypothetical protein